MLRHWGVRARMMNQGAREGTLMYLFPRECRQFKNIGLQASFSVIPEKAGNQNPLESGSWQIRICCQWPLDSRFRGNDGEYDDTP